MIFNKFSLVFKVSIILAIVVFGIIFGRILLKDFGYYEKIQDFDIKFKIQNLTCKMIGRKLVYTCESGLKCYRPYSDAGMRCQNSKTCQGGCEVVLPSEDWSLSQLFVESGRTGCKRKQYNDNPFEEYTYTCSPFFFSIYEPKCAKYPGYFGKPTWEYNDGELILNEGVGVCARNVENSQ